MQVFRMHPSMCTQIYTSVRIQYFDNIEYCTNYCLMYTVLIILYNSCKSYLFLTT